jgi:hypothetical protein
MCKGELSSKSWRREDVESGVKLRSLRRPFHPDVQFLRIYNPGEKSTETRSSQAMTADSRRFISSPSAAPTAPLGLLFLASPEFHRFHLGLDGPRSGI